MFRVVNILNDLRTAHKTICFLQYVTRLADFDLVEITFEDFVFLPFAIAFVSALKSVMNEREKNEVLRIYVIRLFRPNGNQSSIHENSVLYLEGNNFFFFEYYAFLLCCL